MRSRKKTILLWFALLICITAAGFLICSRYDDDVLRAVTDPIAALFSKPTQPDHDAQPGEDPVKDAADEAENIAQPEDQASTPPLLNIPPSVCDPAITELRSQGDLQILTGGSVQVVYYSQGDERWANLKYGSDRIGAYGCGPTAMAMVVSSLTDTLIDPPAMCQWAAENGYWARHSGSYHSIVMGTAAAYGLHAESFSSRSADKLREELFSGKFFVALMGPGHFTQSGHFIILRGVTLSGDVLIADPGSEERSLMVWDAELLLSELSTSTADGSPLWIISRPESGNLE